MSFISHIVRLLVVMLFSVLGASMVFALPTNTSEITFHQIENTPLSQADDVGFATRAPPLAVTDVAVTGGVIVMQGSAFALHGQETVAALFDFDGGFDATNTGVDLNKFSSQDRKSFTTLEKRIVEHEQKLAAFKANPTVRSGMENQPPEVIRAAQERRILHLKREIAAFLKNQNAIVSKYD